MKKRQEKKVFVLYWWKWHWYRSPACVERKFERDMHQAKVFGCGCQVGQWDCCLWPSFHTAHETTLPERLGRRILQDGGERAGFLELGRQNLLLTAFWAAAFSVLIDAGERAGLEGLHDVRCMDDDVWFELIENVLHRLVIVVPLPAPAAVSSRARFGGSLRVNCMRPQDWLECPSLAKMNAWTALVVFWSSSWSRGFWWGCRR